MPATEKTWYDQRLLHTVFGCTGLVLLISTFWMFVQDHEREWKKYQRQMRGVEQKLLGYRLKAAEQAQRSSVADREQDLLVAAAELPPQELIDQFKTAAQGIAELSVDSRLDATYQELAAQVNGSSGLRSSVATARRKVEQAQQAVTAAEEPDEKVAASSALASAEAELVAAKAELNEALEEAATLRSRILARLNRVLKQAQFEMDEAVGARKLAAAEFAKVTADQGLLVRDAMNEAAVAMQVEVDASKESLDAATLRQESTTAQRKDIGDPDVQAHMQYGDTITLRTNGQQTFIDEDVELWINNNPILLSPTVVVTEREDGLDKIELVWRFTVRVDDHQNPNGPNVQHTDLILRRHGDEVTISSGQHPDGEIHGGRAHLH